MVLRCGGRGAEWRAGGVMGDIQRSDWCVSVRVCLWGEWSGVEEE